MIKKPYLVIALLAIVVSSCLKQSIPDAMLDSKNSGHVTATLSYEVNGHPVQISVPDARNQNPNFSELDCTKAGYYIISGESNTGEIIFPFYTDSLKLINYEYTSYYGDMFIIDYNNQAEYVHGPNDKMSFNITSYTDGLISGNFSGRLTPLVSAGYPNDIFGASGSVLITNGLFKNVPVFY